MPHDPRFNAPRTVARALAEVARRHGAARAREAELRAVLPAALGPWLHARIADLRLNDDALTLVMTCPRAAREVENHAGEVHRELCRRLGWAPPRVRVATAAAAPRRAGGSRAPRAASTMPLTARALQEVSDPDLRKRLARWAGIALDAP